MGIPNVVQPAMASRFSRSASQPFGLSVPAWLAFASSLRLQSGVVDLSLREQIQAAHSKGPRQETGERSSRRKR